MTAVEEEVVPKFEPKVGDTLLVRHRTKVNAKTGSVSLEVSSPSLYHIKRVMLDGTVQTNSGDIWKVKRSNEARAKWVTVS